MSSSFQPFLISSFETGINTYLQPWVRPKDAFEPLVNAYVNRGAVNKRAGYSQFGETVEDENPIMGIMRYIDQTTGAISLLVATTENLYVYDAGAYNTVTSPPTFTGNITNFFNYTNWQEVVGSDSLIYMTNNIDPVTTYDGTSADIPTLNIDSTGSPVSITTCLDVQVYKQRMLYILPTLSTGGPQNQSIYWSAVSVSANVIVDVAGNGGFLAAPTGDIIKSAEFIRDALVVFFTNSTWLFRYTGNDTAPFRWDKISNVKSTNSSYGSVAYDERCTSIGSTGLIACDGVNVQRYDIPIIDYYETNFSIQYYGQAFAQRYDNLNQSWMLYVSNQGGVSPDGTEFPLQDGVAPGSDSALIYNFIENSWATYKFAIPLTCLGLFYAQSGTDWQSLTQSWEDTDQAWNTYGSQKFGDILLAGDTTGHVWLMDDDTQVVDYWYTGESPVLTPIPIVPDIISTRWNPLMSQGQKTQFGYIDIYYYISSVDESTPVQVTLNFYIDNSENIATSKTLTLDGPVNSQYAFKRIYCNVIGEFLQMEIDPNVNSYMQFIGFILWVSPAGRLTGP